jgi:hypothetical protein
MKFDGDLMTQAGGTGIDWDWNGNLVQKDETTDTNLVYNWDNKLRSAASPPLRRAEPAT